MGRTPSKLVLLALPCLWASVARADIYFGLEDDVPVFSDRPAAGLVLYLGTNDLPRQSAARQQTKAAFARGAAQYSRLIADVAAEQGIEPALLHAVVQVESGYNERAASSKGAKGLMQLMPDTALSLGVTDTEDPYANLSGGARHLRYLIASFGGDLKLALAAYNAGIGAARRYAPQVPPYPETRAYVAAVMRRYRQLRDMV